MATKRNETKKASTKKQVTNNETRVVCPVCGTEFDVLAEHEHKEKNVTVLGMDSGVGTIVLPVSKRGEALQAAGIDTSKYFSIQIPGGGEQVMMKTDDGRAVPVDAGDPIIQIIIKGGTVPNRKLFRRWVLSQVFHGLTATDYRGNIVGFTEWINRHGYTYQWEMLVDELHVQARLNKNGDAENFRARNRWFDKVLAITMAEDYIEQLRKDANGRPQHKCKGVPYVTVDHTHYFVSDIEKKLIQPMRQLANDILHANTPQRLEDAVRTFWKKAPVKSWFYKQSAEWKDAYKGMGAYAAMQNLLLFHECRFPRNNDFFERGVDNMTLLERAANAYQDGEGWRLFGLLRQLIKENGIDIKKKMSEWAAAKARK